jgi:hypothetical protein
MKVIKHFIVISTMLTLIACGEEQKDSSSINKVSPEDPECTLVYGSGTLVSAYAGFWPRVIDSNGLQAPSAGSPSKPIRFAEVRVKNSAGGVVACGNTDESGNVSVYMPTSNGTFTLEVNSRANNQKVQASVLDNPTDNRHYSLTKAFAITSTSNGSVNAGNLTADYKCPAEEPQCRLESGAFNIFDQIYASNEYLRTNAVTGCSFCETFTVAPKIRAYWTRGFNPYSYLGHPDDALSFYTVSDVEAERNLYILGGSYGDTDSADTDHFDNTIIVHEYAHFLQDTYNRNDFYGEASHDGNSILDPRLAWSEGWANFFQAAVTGVYRYQDSMGNSDGSTHLFNDVSIEFQSAGAGGKDQPTYNGEGVFREFSVARVLIDMIDTSTSGTGKDAFAGSVPFAYIWDTFTKSDSTGFASSDVNFRNIGLFNQFVRSKVATHSPSLLSNFDSLVANEKQYSNASEYGELVYVRQSSCDKTIAGVPDIYLGSTHQYVSHQQRSNDFYDFYYDGTRPFEVTLKYSQTGTKQTDLDIYLYQPEYAYGKTSSIVASSHGSYPEIPGNSQGRETLSLGYITPGHYMINIKVNTTQWTTTADALGNSASYRIEFGSAGDVLCP